jgi:hypothetical protein
VCRLVLVLACGVYGSPSEAQSPANLQERIESLLRTMGGREAWAKTTALRVDATHYEADLAEPYENRILMSFEEPRIRIEAGNETMNRKRAIVGKEGWHSSEKNARRAMTPAQVESDLQWWEAHIYRTLHRLAAQDPALTPALATDGRLLIRQRDGTQLMWIRQNLAGEPVQFGVGELATGTIFGPLLPGDGSRIPRFSVSPDGTWRALIKEIEANPDLSRVDFQRP